MGVLDWRHYPTLTRIRMSTNAVIASFVAIIVIIGAGYLLLKPRPSLPDYAAPAGQTVPAQGATALRFLSTWPFTRPPSRHNALSLK